MPARFPIAAILNRIRVYQHCPSSIIISFTTKPDTFCGSSCTDYSKREQFSFHSAISYMVRQRQVHDLPGCTNYWRSKVDPAMQTVLNFADVESQMMRATNDACHE
jgi:hypothetical protein